MTNALIEQNLAEMAPWHMDIPLPNGMSTASGNQSDYDDPDLQNVSVIALDEMRAQVCRMYPNGLSGKTFLDVGCNAGGYCFMANELDAEFAYGFDVRDHWINQAKLVADLKEISSDRIEFATHHLDELDSNRKFDITMFKGVFYHLPDPIHSLKFLADLTAETMILDSASRNDIPEDCLVASFESTTHVMSGVDKLNWYPGGPKMLQNVFDWCGFPHFTTVYWNRDCQGTNREDLGRLRVIASRKAEVIEAFRESRMVA